MESLLFLSQRIPYPPNKGDKIRSYNILKHLAKTFRVRLGAFVDEAEDWAHSDVLDDLCEETCFVPLNRRWATLRSARGLVTGQALNVPYFRDRRMADWVAATTGREVPSVVFVYSSAVGQYLDDVAGQPERTVVDFVDVDSDKWRQYASTQRWPMRWVYAREARTLLNFDRALAARSDASVLVSADEAALFRRLAPESSDKIAGIGNGIDAEYFSPDNAYPTVAAPGRAVVTFTGAMDYRPNVDAVVWFVRDILPEVRRQAGPLTFYIVGSNPAPDVLALASGDDVKVTGRVEDVRPYLAGATAAVAPMRIARGIQNKVLEAMAMARPTVTTPQGLEGIAAEPGRHLLIAEDAPGFAAATAAAIQDAGSAALGTAARQHVVEHFSWAARLAAYDRIIAGEQQASL